MQVFSTESSTLCTTSLSPKLFPKFGKLLPGAAGESLPTTRPSRGLGAGPGQNLWLGDPAGWRLEVDPAAPREFQGGAAASPRPRQEQGAGRRGGDGWMVRWDRRPRWTPATGIVRGRRYTAVHTVLTVNSASPAMMSEGCRFLSYMGFSKVPLTLVFSWPA